MLAKGTNKLTTQPTRIRCKARHTLKKWVNSFFLIIRGVVCVPIAAVRVKVVGTDDVDPTPEQFEATKAQAVQDVRLA